MTTPADVLFDGKPVDRSNPIPTRDTDQPLTLTALLDRLDQLLAQQRLTNAYLAELVGDVLTPDDVEAH